MAAAVTAIRKNNERKALENERKERETEGLPVAPSTPKSAPKAKVRDAATFVNADYGNITPHFPGVFFPVGTGRLLPHQLAACKLYNTGLITWSIASVIIFNFFAIAAEKEIDPYPCPDPPLPCLQQYKAVWVTLDDVCNWIFLFELILNYYGAGHKRFWSSGWNRFDFLIVFVGVLTLLRIPLGPFSMLKMMRAFRVFRLFKRIKSLNKIIMALLNAIPGVMNAFVIMIIFMAIYAILAVEFFRDFGKGYQVAEYTTMTGNYVEGSFEENITAITARGFTIGDEYYGTFSRSMYTLFQVMTGESWSEAIARPLVFGYSPPYGAVLVGVFFTSFILLMQIVLVNVVVAVLLDKFVADEDKEEEEQADGEGDDIDVDIASPAAAASMLFSPQLALDAPVPPSPQASNRTNLLELSARVQSVEAKLDTIMKMLSSMGAKGGPSA